MAIPALLISFFLSGCSTTEINSNVPSYQDIIQKINGIYPGITDEKNKIWEILEEMLDADTSIQKKKKAIECKINRISRQNQKDQKTKIEIEKLKYFSFLKKEILTHIISLIDYSYNLEVRNVEVERQKIAKKQLSAAKDRFEVGTITRADVAFSESELHNATTKKVFTELALSNNKMNEKKKIILNTQNDLLNDNNISKLEEIYLESNTKLYIKELEVKVEEKCNKKEKKYNLEKIKIEGLNKIETIKNKIKTYQALKISNKEEIKASEIYYEGVLSEAEIGSRTTIDVFNSMNSLQNAKLESIKIKAEILKSYYQLVFLTI